MTYKKKKVSCNIRTLNELQILFKKNKIKQYS